MDIRTFLDEFGIFVNAPGGTLKIREIILFLAVSGKLLSYINNQKPSDLLFKIEKELKDYFVRFEKKNKKKKIIHKIKQNNIFPKHWDLVNLSQIGVLIRGVSYKKSIALNNPKEGYIGLLRSNNIGFEINYDNLIYIPKDVVKKEQIILGGDILIAMSSGSKNLVGKAAQIANVTTITNFSFGAFCGVFRCMPSAYNKYISMLLLSPVYRNYISLKGRGIGINNLTKTNIENFYFGFPPLEEQKRIVTKVDELMSLCDKLESLQKKRERLCKLTRTSALDALANAQNSDELRNAWDRMQGNLHLLFDDSKCIDSFRKCLFDIVIKGYLSTYHCNDTSISKTLNSIDLKRQMLIKQKKLKKSKPISYIRKKEVPFNVPINWQWVKLDQVSKKIEYGTSQKAHKEESGIPILRMGNIINGKIDTSNLKYVNGDIKELPRLYLKKKDLIFNRTNSFELVGKMGIFEHDDDTYTLASYLIRISLFNEFVNPYYINLYFQSSICRRIQIEPNIIVQTNQANFNGTKLRNVLIPLPPIEEQERIVSRTNRILYLFDKLEKQLNKTKDIAELITKTFVSSITGTQSKEPKIMKLPKTELISILKLAKTPKKKDHAPLSTILLKHKGELSAKALWHNTGMEIDEFYQQLKNEMAKGWIVEPEKAYMKVLEEPDAS